MVSTAVVHVIGSTAFIVLIVFTIAHVTSTMKIMEKDLTREYYEKIADSISVQVLYCLFKNSNLTLKMEYPVTVGYNKPYNIIIGSGEMIKSKYPFLTGLTSSNIYVVVISTDNNIYAYRIIVGKSYNNKIIVLNKDPALFGSTTLTYINITVLRDSIYIDFIIKGVLYR